jgi:hypothetical protein
MNYCSVIDNSTGGPALMSAEGSNSIAANNLVLHASPVPNKFGMFFYGKVFSSAKSFGNGFRCTDAPLFRLKPVLMASGNILSLATDYTTLPMNSGGGAVSSGTTCFFQAWFRDPMGGGSLFNTSDGFEITFQP